MGSHNPKGSYKYLPFPRNGPSKTRQANLGKTTPKDIILSRIIHTLKMSLLMSVNPTRNSGHTLGSLPNPTRDSGHTLGSLPNVGNQTIDHAQTLNMYHT